jgi:hypothetical protein
MAVTKSSTSNLYTKQSFNRLGAASSSQTNTPTTPNIDYLIVAGGAGGGAGTGGGGGAGGLLLNTASVSLGSSYTITVGAGGTNGVSRSSFPTNGSNSTAFGITATGGGYGGSDPGAPWTRVPSSGGSGGGASFWSTGQSGGAGTSGQGFAGGSSGGTQGGSGGGGAGAVGSTHTGAGTGVGGIGVQTSITGAATYFGGGGGGDASNGGLGGGGAGGSSTATSGTVNTGGGGGGGSLHAGSISGSGGSGVVILAYPSNYNNITSIGGGLTYTLDTTTRVGYKVYKFTAGTGTITI